MISTIYREVREYSRGFGTVHDIIIYNHGYTIIYDNFLVSFWIGSIYKIMFRAYNSMKYNFTFINGNLLFYLTINVSYN